MTNLVQSLFRIDPTEGLVDYVTTVKPYHTKILEVLIEYVFTEKIDVSVTDRWMWNMWFSRTPREVIGSCGYGYRWDAQGINAPNIYLPSSILQAQGKVLIDVSTAADNSLISIIRNTSGHSFQVGDSVVFDTDTDISIKCFDSNAEDLIDECAGRVGVIESGRTYYVVSSGIDTVEVSEHIGGAPITFTVDDVIRIMPYNVQFNSFLIEPQSNTISCLGLVTSHTANQMSFVAKHTITGVNTTDNEWRVQVGTWTQGTGYVQGTQSNVVLVGGNGTGATASVVVDSSGQVAEVIIQDPGSGYVAGDVLVALDLMGTPGSGFQFKVTGRWTAGSGYTAGTYTNVPLIGGTGMGAKATITADSQGHVTDVVVSDVGSGYTQGDVLYSVLPGGSGFTLMWTTTDTLTISLHEGESIYVNGNVQDSIPSAANGKYTVDYVTGSVIRVKENVPPLITATGNLYTTDWYSPAMVWSPGTKVRVTSPHSLPEPLQSTSEYFFVPTETMGVFNLATKRYPREFADYINVASLGSELYFERVEPFTPGDYISIDNSPLHHNDGRYMVSTVAAEGDNFRIGVLQPVKHTTPVPNPYLSNGTMSIALGSYDLPQYCPPIQSPDLYAGAYIHENIQFTFSINERDFVGSNIIENNIEGWGIDPFGDMMSMFGSGSEKFVLYTSMTDGVYSGGTAASAHTLMPTGYDTQLFDVGAMDENLHVAVHLQSSFPAP